MSSESIVLFLETFPSVEDAVNYIANTMHTYCNSYSSLSLSTTENCNIETNLLTTIAAETFPWFSDWYVTLYAVEPEMWAVPNILLGHSSMNSGDPKESPRCKFYISEFHPKILFGMEEDVARTLP